MYLLLFYNAESTRDDRFYCILGVWTSVDIYVHKRRAGKWFLFRELVEYKFEGRNPDFRLPEFEIRR